MIDSLDAVGSRTGWTGRWPAWQFEPWLGPHMIDSICTGEAYFELLGVLVRNRAARVEGHRGFRLPTVAIEVVQMAARQP